MLYVHTYVICTLTLKYFCVSLALSLNVAIVSNGIFLSGKTGLSLTASSNKQSRNQSELLAYITNLEPSLSKRYSFSKS